MAGKVNILGISGSMEQRSNSAAAVRIALEAAEAAGAATKLLDIAELDLPMFVPKMDPSEAVQDFVERVSACDGMLWCSPLYHGTITGSFKNALDWLELLARREPAYLTDKVVGLIATAGGAQGLQAINTMEFIVRSLRGWTVPLVVPIARAWDVFSRDGSLTDDRVRDQLTALGSEVTRAASVFATHRMTTREAAEAQNVLEPRQGDPRNRHWN